MPVTSPAAQPVRQWSVALAATRFSDDSSATRRAAATSMAMCRTVASYGSGRATYCPSVDQSVSKWKVSIEVRLRSSEVKLPEAPS